MNDPWCTPSFELPPVATATGPFPRPGFLSAVCDLSGAESAVEVVADADGLVALVRNGDTVRLAGDHDLTDYHSPLGSRIEEVLGPYLERVEPATRFELDSLPLEAAEVLAKALERAGIAVEMTAHAVCAVLDLPSDFEQYLDRIGKKQRHELRRKRRRYEDLVGEVRFETHHDPGWAFDEFVRLHRLSAGAKGRFMSPEMVGFFARLLARPEWRVEALRIPGTDRAAACLFVTTDADGYYLYNSAYDPALSEGSPGMAILGSAIEAAIAQGFPRFDFLKGDEVYKFRLGAEERPLYRLVGER